MYRLVIEKYGNREKNIFEDNLFQIEERKAISLDLEGLNVGNGPNSQITMIQIGMSNGLCLIFDILKCPGLIEILKPTLENEQIIKIMHGPSNDILALKNEYGITIRSIFDTQNVYKIINNSNKLIGLNDLCTILNVPLNPVKDDMKNQYWIWDQRPLTKRMLDYASYDVFCLWDIFLTLEENLIGLKRKQFIEKMLKNFEAPSYHLYECNDADNLKKVAQNYQIYKLLFNSNSQVLDQFVRHFESNDSKFVYMGMGQSPKKRQFPKVFFYTALIIVFLTAILYFLNK